MNDTRLLRIRASAGSGKTYALTGHFLRLLAGAQGASLSGAACQVGGGPRTHAWPEILAVTFTNRAAAEMKERIIRRLKLMALGHEADMPAPWTSALAADWLETLLRRYGALNVRTIDSLLHMLVRLAALELGLPPDFEPVFADDEALAPLLDGLLERARTEPDLRADLERACAVMLMHTPHRGFMSGAKLRKEVLGLMFAAPGPTGEGFASPDDVIARLAALCADVRAQAHALRALATAEELPLSQNTHKALHACLHSPDAAMPPGSAMLRKEDLDACLLKAGKGTASTSACRAYARLQDAVARMDAQAPMLRGALRLLPFFRLARRAAAELPEYLQSQSLFPAVLTPALARQTLEGGYGVSEAFCRMGASLTHILIDEFQDTSREQWAALHPLVLEALSRGGSLTWVGDVKQAIYGWRGGDAALFAEVLGDRELVAVGDGAHTDTLPVNRRSRAAVVRANNSVFSRLARPEAALAALAAMLPDTTPRPVLEQAARQVAEGFADAAQLESGKEGGYVRLERLEGDSVAALRAVALERLSELVREIATRRPYGDITVLVRSNEQAGLIAARLLGEGVPVVTENSLLLAEHPLISQCVAFLRWVNAPYDATAFWSVVAGPRLLLPLADLPRAALEDWLAGRTGQERALPLTEAFRRAFPDIWRQWLEPFHSRAGLMTPYDAVREMLARWQVWERLPEEGPFLQRLLEILHGAEQEGHASVAAFIAHWDAHGRQEKAPMPDAVDAVRVMTMHKSKGLQFPVVIVPWNDGTPQADPVPVPVESDGLRLIAPRNTVPGSAHAEALAAVAAESLNLLYVAWTRAEDCLYALLSASRAGLGLALEGLLREAADAPSTPWREEDGALVIGKPDVPVVPGKPDVRAVPGKPDVPAVPDVSGMGPELGTDPALPLWRPMQWLPRLKVYRSTPDDLLFSPRRRGSFLHACLETFADMLGQTAAIGPDAIGPDAIGPDAIGPDAIGPDALALVADAAREATRRFPLPVPAALAHEAEGCLTWFTTLPGALDWLREGASEQPLLDATGQQYRPDLIVPPRDAQDGDGWLVIEYKSGQAVPEHVAQIGRYLAILEDISRCPARGLLVYLDARRTLTVAPHRL